MKNNDVDLLHSGSTKREISNRVKESIYNSVSPLLNGITASDKFQKAVKKATKNISAAILTDFKHTLKKERKEAEIKMNTATATDPAPSEKKAEKIAANKEGVKDKVSKKAVKKVAIKPVKKTGVKVAKKAAVIVAKKAVVKVAKKAAVKVVKKAAKKAMPKKSKELSTPPPENLVIAPPAQES